MGYKILGFAVWQGAKWYLRRRVGGTKSKAAVAGLSAALLAGAVIASRQSTSHQ